MAIERRFNRQASTINILASSPWRKPVILGGLSSFVGDCSKVNDFALPAAAGAQNPTENIGFCKFHRVRLGCHRHWQPISRANQNGLASAALLVQASVSRAREM